MSYCNSFLTEWIIAFFSLNLIVGLSFYLQFLIFCFSTELVDDEFLLCCCCCCCVFFFGGLNISCDWLLSVSQNIMCIWFKCLLKLIHLTCFTLCIANAHAPFPFIYKWNGLLGSILCSHANLKASFLLSFLQYSLRITLMICLTILVTVDLLSML